MYYIDEAALAIYNMYHMHMRVYFYFQGADAGQRTLFAEAATVSFLQTSCLIDD